MSGGPGSGKTTIALLKAQRRAAALLPGQEVLFLSFSRAAVRQIVTTGATILSSEEKKLIQVKTYHLFCLQLLESHGRLLTGIPARFLVPGEERLRKSTHEGEWEKERARLAEEQGLFCFDLLAASVATLLEGSAALRDLYSDKYPMVIVDEFQDTDDDQWRVVKALAQYSEMVCLADPDQRIFDYRPNIDPKRIDRLCEQLSPAEFDLGSENHRSPAGGILAYADCILRNHYPLPNTPDVQSATYYPNSFHAAVHAYVRWMFDRLWGLGVESPSVAVLCRSNPFVADLSAILLETHMYTNREFQPIPHDVVWDADLSAVAGQVVGSIMEWPTRAPRQATSRTLALISEYFGLKNAEAPSKTASTKTRQYMTAADDVIAGKIPRIKAAKALFEAAQRETRYSGDPVRDWLLGRRILESVRALNEVVLASRMIRLFQSTDALAAGLSDLWLTSGQYSDAAGLIKRTLDRERLMSAEKVPSGCILMTMHKSKGKEFDGVVLVEGRYKSLFFSQHDGPGFERSRRLLRVAITRAKKAVTIIRPYGSPELVDPNKEAWGFNRS